MRIMAVLSMPCVIFFAVLLYLFVSIASADSDVKIVKKPAGWKVTASPYAGDLTVKDRAIWRSVLHWCEECEIRDAMCMARWEGIKDHYGGIYVYPLGGNDYIVGVNCNIDMGPSENIIYKVRENPDTIESRLLRLEQFEFIEATDSIHDTDVYREHEQKGRFIRYTDPLIYGSADVDKEKKLLIIYHAFRGSGGCGLQTTYDVSGDVPKVVDFRAKTYCSANTVAPEKWKVYPAKQRAKWHIGRNPLREDWKDEKACQ